jgi:acyl-CoA thioester hydrolase
MRSLSNVHEARLRVRYAETDQMGIVHHANYLVWMEVGRTELSKSLGIHYSEIEQAGYFMTVVEVSVRYAQAARYDDEVVVQTRIASANPRFITFEYELTHGATGARLVTGETKHLFCARTGGGLRPAKLPERFHAYFGITGR